MNLREKYSSRQTGLINAPAPAYTYENVQIWVPLPVIPVTETLPLIQEKYDFEGEEANRNAYTGSEYDPPDFHRTLESVFAYQFPEPEYYTSTNPIDRAYQISRQTNCMGGAPRLPGLLPCPYGTDAIACAYHAA